MLAGAGSNLTSCWQALRSAFEKDAVDTGRDRLLLTAALWSHKDTVENVYEVEKLHL